jgi:peptide/nickel transport system substrate-binding protein
VRSRKAALAVVVAATALVVSTVSACSGSSSGGGGGSTNGASGGNTGTTSNTGGGTPHTGGVLTMLGIGDVDYMDPNVSYNGVGNDNLRMWSRNLYTYPATAGQTTVVTPDLATALPQISSDGLTYTVTIKTGAMWNTSPARQVTGADAVRGLERSCNPAEPAGALGDYEALVQGMSAFCTAFEKVKPNVGAIKAFLSSHSISGATVSPSNPLTVIYKLTQPATYFTNLMAMTNFAPAPVEYLNYVPASAQLAQHTIADGPYEIKSYVPARSIDYVRNPAWKASTDPIRKAYVDEIKVNETGNETSIQQQIAANTSAADMEWGHIGPPTSAIPALVAAKDPRFVTGPTFGLDPYILFNLRSPNNSSALADVTVRQAISDAIDRNGLVQDAGGPSISPPQTHVLPPGIPGSKNFDLYPHNTSKAKSLLGGKKLTLKMLYQSDDQTQTKIFQSVQSNLAQVGIKVEGLGVPSADIYTKYLEVPAVASRGVWDIALTSWNPDWYGNNAVNYFLPIFASTSFPPNSANMGFFANSSIDSLIQKGETAVSQSAASADWAALDQKIMALAPIYPINSPNFVGFHSSLVHNAVYVPYLDQFDPTNVWLSS